MEQDLITPENVSVQSLQAIFDAAFIDYEIDSEGDLYVRDKVSAYVFPSAEKKKIRFLTIYRFNESVSEDQQTACANRINREYIMARAYSKNGRLSFDYDLMIDGGISRKVFILAFKRFCSIPQAAVTDLANDLIA